jgi:hypothetical protein
VTGNTNINAILNVTGNTNIASNLNVTGNTNIASNLNVTGNTNIASNLNVTGNTNIAFNLNVTGNTNIASNLNVTGNLTVTGFVRFSDLLINQCLTITGNTTLTYPLYNSYNITSNSNIAITLPIITGNIIGSTINLFKSGNSNMVLNVNSTATNDKFVENGKTIQANTFIIPGGTTSASLIASTGSPNNYWTGIGGGGGGTISGDAIIGGNIVITGNSTLSNVSIAGATANSAYRLNVNGGVQANSYNATSDRRLKSNIRFLSNQSTAILHIAPVTFDWKIDGKHDIGFIAQNVYNTYPELRPKMENIDPSSNIDEPTDSSGNPIYYAMDYGKMTPFLWQGMREIIQRLEMIEIENSDLKTRIEILESK